MADILIKGMEMPKRGYTLTLHIRGDGLAWKELRDENGFLRENEGLGNVATQLPTHGDWHTGDPTEEGWYVIKVAADCSYITNYWKNGHWRHPLYYNYCVWRMIED